MASLGINGLSKFRSRTNLMHFLLPICGKFTRALLAHKIFLYFFWDGDPALCSAFIYRQVRMFSEYGKMINFKS
jgi:hypothetical protein